MLIYVFMCFIYISVPECAKSADHLQINRLQPSVKGTASNHILAVEVVVEGPPPAVWRGSCGSESRLTWPLCNICFMKYICTLSVYFWITCGQRHTHACMSYAYLPINTHIQNVHTYLELDWHWSQPLTSNRVLHQLEHQSVEAPPQRKGRIILLSEFLKIYFF